MKTMVLDRFAKRPENEFIDVTERFNVDHLKWLSKLKDFSFLDDDDDEEKVDSIPFTLSKILKDLKKNKTDSLKRTLVQRNGMGRYYYPKAKDNYGILYLKNAVRGFIAQEGTLDLDIKNCHPTLLAQLIKENDVVCKGLDAYVHDREETMKKYGFDKDVFLVMINDKNFKSDNEFLNSVHKTIYTTFIPIMKEKYKELYNQCVNHDKAKDKKRQNVEGTFVSRILQEAEQDVMYYCMEFLKNENIDYGCLIYDGIHIYDELEPITISILSDYIAEKCGYKVTFSIKPFPKQDLIMSKVNEFLETEKDKESTYENDLVSMMFERFQKQIKYYDETLYLKDQDHKWYCSKGTIQNILIRWMFEVNKQAAMSKFDHIKKIFEARASIEFLDRSFKDKFDTTTKNKLCFVNGYLDLITRKFVKWGDETDEIFTDMMIDYNYEPSDSRVRKILFDKIINPIFNDNEQLIDEVLSYCARALGMNKDKLWLTAEGERDSGKGVITKLFQNSFEPYVFEFSSINLILRRNLEGEVRNTWAEPFVKSRLGFCNETMEVSDDGTSKSKLDGTRIKKLTSGGDEIQIKLMKENAKSEMIRANMVMFQQALPACSPSDAMQNMLSFRFPCYFAEKKRMNEFAVFRPIDYTLKSWIESDEALRCAFVDIVVSFFKSSIPEYKILRQGAQDVVDVEIEEDYDTRLRELFQITDNDEDIISSDNVQTILKANQIMMVASKVKNRLERYGAVYGKFYVNKKQVRGYRKIKLVEVDTESSLDQ